MVLFALSVPFLRRRLGGPIHKFFSFFFKNLYLNTEITLRVIYMSFHIIMHFTKIV